MALCEIPPVKNASWVGAVLALGFAVSASHAGPFGIFGPFLLDRTNRRLCGQVIDYTKNHGADRRIWSEALQEKRDLYVYLPPGYDPCKKYPVALWLHTFREDEMGFLEEVVGSFDQAIACGQLPPFIIAVPDGSIKGRRTFLQAGSFFVNSNAGCFEDYVINDVWPFVQANYPVRPEREAHAIMGASMGGFAAYNLGFKHRDKFKTIVGVFPPLNLRWEDCHGRYMGNFDPCCWGWRTEHRRHAVVARIYGIPIRLWQLTDPIYGKGPEVIDAMQKENPIELLETLNIKPGELDLYVAYAGKDEFNIDAQVESFLHVARERGLDITVGYDPKGRHSYTTAKKLFPGIAEWLRPRLQPFAE